MKKILIINPFGIGDCLFTTPVIRAIKENYPDAFVGYWCNIRVEDLLKNNPRIDKIFALSRGDLKKIYKRSIIEGISRFLILLRGLRKERFEICLDFSSEHRYSLVAKLLGIKKRIGFNYKNRGKFLTDKVDVDGYSFKHIVEYYADLLGPLGIKAKDLSLELGVSQINKDKARSYLNRFKIKPGELLIGIAPGAGASWGKDASLKHLAPIKYAQLAERLAQELNARILLLGDESERPIADIIINAIEHKPIDLVGKISLGELVGLISNLNILVTNDGGPLHIAVALGIKTVSVFGPVDDLVYGPYPPSEKHIVVKHKISCQPCYRDFKMPVCDKERACINMIDVDDIFQSIRRLI